MSLSGFSLLELLLVICLVAVLAAMLLPWFSYTKNRARGVACKSNLRQLGIGLTLYLNEFDKYPPTLVATPTPWDTLIFPYVEKGKRAYFCPSTNVESSWDGTVTNLFSHRNPRFNPSYGMNGAGTAYYIDVYHSLGLLRLPEVKESEVSDPSNMMAIGDLTRNDDGDIAGNLAEPDDFVGSVHFGGGNVVFCDDHVEWAKQTKWMHPKERTRRRWNADHRPHPETWH